MMIDSISELLAKKAGALDRIRTCGFLLRRQTLYPLSYKGTPHDYTL